jgi:hypothetical protein
VVFTKVLTMYQYIIIEFIGLSIMRFPLPRILLSYNLIQIIVVCPNSYVEDYGSHSQISVQLFMGDFSAQKTKFIVKK